MYLQSPILYSQFWLLLSLLRWMNGRTTGQPFSRNTGSKHSWTSLKRTMLTERHKNCGQDYRWAYRFSRKRLSLMSPPHACGVLSGLSQSWDGQVVGTSVTTFSLCRWGEGWDSPLAHRFPSFYLSTLNLIFPPLPKTRCATFSEDVRSCMTCFKIYSKLLETQFIYQSRAMILILWVVTPGDQTTLSQGSHTTYPAYQMLTL